MSVSHRGVPAKAKRSENISVRTCRQGFDGTSARSAEKKMSIDIEHDFQPEYVPIEG